MGRGIFVKKKKDDPTLDTKVHYFLLFTPSLIIIIKAIERVFSI